MDHRWSADSVMSCYLAAVSFQEVFFIPDLIRGQVYDKRDAFAVALVRYYSNVVFEHNDVAALPFVNLIDICC